MWAVACAPAWALAPVLLWAPVWASGGGSGTPWAKGVGIWVWAPALALAWRLASARRHCGRGGVKSMGLALPSAPWSLAPGAATAPALAPAPSSARASALESHGCGPSLLRSPDAAHRISLLSRCPEVCELLRSEGGAHGSMPRIHTTRPEEVRICGTKL